MLSRRQFLASTAIATALAGWSGGVRAASLESRTIPASGEALPVIGLGSWRNFDAEPGTPEYLRAAETLQIFAERGGRLIDSSPMYGRSSQRIGDIARAAGVADRLFYASKVWTRGHAAGRAQLLQELQRFGRSQLDLVQVHNLSDVDVQLRMLAEQRSAGRVRLLGISHYQASAHAEIERLLQQHKLDCLQVNLSVVEPEAERRLLAVAAERGTAVLANRVFAEGALFERVRGKSLPEFTAELGIASWAQFFIKWVLGAAAVTAVITGTGNPRHMADNLAAGQAPWPDAAMRRRMADHVLAL